MTLQEILASLLSPGGVQQNQLAMAGAPTQVGDHNNPALLAGQMAQFQQPQAPQAAPAPPQAPQGQPMPQSAPAAPPMAAPAPSGGGVGGFLSNLLQGPQAAQKNQTIQWLKQQGMDDGQATMFASNKPVLQQYLLTRAQGKKPIEVNGRLVDPNDFHVLADFSDKSGDGQTRTMSKEESDKLGLPEGSYQMDSKGKISSVGGVREQDPTFGREKDLRQQYESQEPVKTYQIVRDNYERIRQGVQQGTGAGDLAIVFGYMKMLDPTSVVREGEQASASNTAGVPAAIRNTYNSIMSGDKLSPEARQQLLSAAQQVYSESSNNLGALNKRYGAIAGNWKLDPARIIMDPEQYDPLAPPAQTGGDLPLPPPETAPGYTPGAPAAVTPGGRRVIQQMTNPAPVKDWKEWFKKKGG